MPEGQRAPEAGGWQMAPVRADGSAPGRRGSRGALEGATVTHPRALGSDRDARTPPREPRRAEGSALAVCPCAVSGPGPEGNGLLPSWGDVHEDLCFHTSLWRAVRTMRGENPDCMSPFLEASLTQQSPIRVLRALPVSGQRAGWEGAARGVVS